MRVVIVLSDTQGEHEEFAAAAGLVRVSPRALAQTHTDALVDKWCAKVLDVLVVLRAAPDDAEVVLAVTGSQTLRAPEIGLFARVAVRAAGESVQEFARSLQPSA